MVRVLAIIAVGMLLTGCGPDSSASARASLQEQQRKQLKKDLDKVQSQINRNVQNSIAAGQNAINSAKPRAGR